MLFLAGFIPSKGASEHYEPSDSLPIRRSVELTTDGQKRAYIYGDWGAADSLYRLAILADSLYAPAHYALAQNYSMRRMQSDSVVKYSGNAYLVDTLNKWYREAYAQALAIGGEFTHARQLYQKGIESEPQTLSNYVMVAMLHRQQGEVQAAIEVLDSAEVRVGKSSYISTLKRDLLLSSGRQQEAISEVEELISLEPDMIEHRLTLAQIYIDTKQDSLAGAQYRRAVEVDPSSLEAIWALSQFSLDRGEIGNYLSSLKLLFASPQESLDNKISTFSRLTADKAFYAKNFFSINELATQLYLLDSADKRLVELYATHLIASGSLDKALEIYKEHALGATPEQEYFESVISIESYKQRADSVERYATIAIERYPTHHPFRLSLSNLYSYTKRHDEAIASYKEVLKRVEQDSLRSSIWGYIGDNYHQKSLAERPESRKERAMMRQAYKAYDNALEADRNNPLVLNNYAYFLSLEQRDLGKALDMAGRAIALVSSNPTYLDTYAWILYELERYDEAKTIMRQVIALDTTGSAEIQFHYAEILAALGESFMAEIYYDKALKLGYDPATIESKKAKLQ